MPKTFATTDVIREFSELAGREQRVSSLLLVALRALGNAVNDHVLEH